LKLRLRRLLYPRAAAVVVLLDQIARRMREEWSLSRVEVIPTAQTFEPGELVPLERRPPVVISVGRLHPIKGLPSLLRAWQQSTARHRGWRLRIVGEGPQRGELEQLITELGVTDSVEMPGAVLDVAAEYRSARVFALPSKGEGFPNSLLEAMTFGCACIATTCPGGPSEMLNYGQAGILVPVDDVVELCGALERLTSDSQRAAEDGAAAALRATDFDEATVLDLWESVLARAAHFNGAKRRDHATDG
jgi:GalNAc-alpha-(1->4)-GalNAc-alpha-(1->3)-diNAcBac-PP-undecaprenol alpha-1,4-N-acetyl-D-galactosaminyltransferase